MTILNLGRIAGLCACFLAAGCQFYSLVPAERVSVGGDVTLEPDIEWNKRTQDHYQIWTVDGEGLQALHIYKGLEDGETMFKLNNSEKQENMPQYDTSMSLLELREFIEASVVQAGFSNVKTLKFQPAKFAGMDGFRFEFAFTNVNGLRQLGFATGAQGDDRLYLIYYRGAKLYYYEKYLKSVEDMIRGIELAWASSLI